MKVILQFKACVGMCVRHQCGVGWRAVKLHENSGNIVAFLCRVPPEKKPPGGCFDVNSVKIVSSSSKEPNRKIKKMIRTE